MKKVMVRGLLGFPLGVFIGYAISIVISLVMEDGKYVPAVPSLIAQSGSEINAVMIQFALSGILGAASAAGSVVWETDRWSILKQTFIHFLILSLTMLPIAYFTHWMEHSFTGFAGYFGIFIAIYAGIWAVQYTVWKRKIEKLNHTIRERNQRRD